MIEEKKQYCGYISLMGRPNVGKSTLLNALVREKLSGVSAKPQTTRGVVRGIVTENSAQMIFVDPPGFLKVKGETDTNLNPLAKAIDAEAWRQVSDADLLCYLIDLPRARKFYDSDLEILNGLINISKKPFFILFTQIDRMKKNEGLEIASELRTKFLLDLPLLEDKVRHWTCLSAKNSQDLIDLKAEFLPHIPEGPHLFPDDQISDKSTKSLVAEHVREQVFRQFSKEIPYEVTSHVQSYRQATNGVIHIELDLIVSRENLKAMIIGKGGQKLKTIGEAARHSLEAFLDSKVNLKIFVKVQKNWSRSDKLIEELEGLGIGSEGQ